MGPTSDRASKPREKCMTEAVDDARPDEDLQPTENPPHEEAQPQEAAATAELVPADQTGFLTIRTGQNRLSPDQRAAFAAIVNFDPGKDPASWPHINVFLQVCQELGLSPWSKKLYLIKRGSGEYASYTIQTGIHGLTELAQRTGRYRRVAGLYWTGPDDNPDWWWLDRESTPGMVVRRRVWVDAWIWPDRHPAAAKAIVEYYDKHGQVQQQEGLAHWGMFAPYTPK